MASLQANPGKQVLGGAGGATKLVAWVSRAGSGDEIGGGPAELTRNPELDVSKGVGY